MHKIRQIMKFTMLLVLMLITMSISNFVPISAQKSFQMISPLPNDESLCKNHEKFVYIRNYDPFVQEKYMKKGEVEILDTLADALSMYEYKIDGENDIDDSNAKVVKSDTGITIHNDKENYIKAKSIYYKYNYEKRKDTSTPPNDEFKKVVPKFNIHHYNEVASLINEMLDGNDTMMKHVEPEVLESAQLLTLYRLFMMINKEVRTTKKNETEIFAKEEKRIDFMHALCRTHLVEEKGGYQCIKGKRLDPDKTLTKGMLRSITVLVDEFRKDDESSKYSPKLVRNFDKSKKMNLIKATLGGLYNVNPSVKMTSIHLLRRLGASSVMLDDVEFVMNSIKETPIFTEKVKFIDTNIFVRNDFPRIDHNKSRGKQKFPEHIKKDYQARSIIYTLSQDFETYFFMPYGTPDFKETVTFYDMKPGYSPNNPYRDPNLPEIKYDNNVPVDTNDLFDFIPISNPSYKEELYEYPFYSYGMYQYKSPAEELYKLYGLIRRETLTEKIKSNKDTDIFEHISEEDFKFLSQKIDNEHILRIPMLSFLGKDPEKTLDVKTGDYDIERAFYIEREKFDFIEDNTTKYPIFRGNQIKAISMGIKNDSYIVRRGTAEYIIRFYNFYRNIGRDLGKYIHKIMNYYISEGTVVEETKMIKEGIDPQNKHVIKAGTRLGNEFDPEGVMVYKNIPADERRELRKKINHTLKKEKILKYK